ncbi:MAG: WcaF family extracellular polysaccharide biosynthesis acetyltransferase [Flavobacteriales bacterium]
MNTTRLDLFNNAWYRPGSAIKRALWYVCSWIFLQSYFPFSGFKVFVLCCFGARMGKGIRIKPSVRIKYPWKLTVGDHSWIGEDVWIDNLDEVVIGAHCCLSQGAMLLCGNHHYGKSSFDLITKPITLDQGVWIGAKSVVCPGVHAEHHAVLTVGSIATSHLEAMSIYQGNPARLIKKRNIAS